MLEWGGSILSPDVKTNSKKTNNTAAIKTTVFRLGEWFKNNIWKRKFSVKIGEDDLPSVPMNMDIEGSEIDVISDIIFTGRLQCLNKVMTESHERLKKQEGKKQTQNFLHNLTAVLSNYTKIMHKEKGLFGFSLIDFDDELYRTTKHLLPQC